MSDTINPKLKAMMEALAVKTEIDPEAEAQDSDGVDFSPNALLGKLLKASNSLKSNVGGGSASDVFANNPTKHAPLIASQNSSAVTFMPQVKIEDWLVNVYPESSNVIHFQAKASSTVQAYTKWYVVADPEKWKQVKAAYDAGTNRRNSFWQDSSKQYLVAKRIAEDVVDIPGYGPISVPELFK